MLTHHPICSDTLQRIAHFVHFKFIEEIAIFLIVQWSPLPTDKKCTPGKPREEVELYMRQVLFTSLLLLLKVLDKDASTVAYSYTSTWSAYRLLLSV